MAGKKMIKKTDIEVKPPKKTFHGKIAQLPLPNVEDAFAVYLELKGNCYATAEHYSQNAHKMGLRAPSRGTVMNWQKKYNWKERLDSHQRQVEQNVVKQHAALTTRKVLDARKEVEDVCGLIFERLKSVIPSLPIKTASDVRQLGLVTKDYLEIRDAIEGTGKDKEAEEVAKSAEQRVQEASQQSAVLFEQLRKAHVNEFTMPN